MLWRFDIYIYHRLTVYSFTVTAKLDHQCACVRSPNVALVRDRHEKGFVSYSFQNYIPIFSRIALTHHSDVLTNWWSAGWAPTLIIGTSLWITFRLQNSARGLSTLWNFPSIRLTFMNEENPRGPVWKADCAWFDVRSRLPQITVIQISVGLFTIIYVRSVGYVTFTGYFFLAFLEHIFIQGLCDSSWNN